MQKFVITTDNMADLPEAYYGEHQIPLYVSAVHNGWRDLSERNELKSKVIFITE